MSTNPVFSKESVIEWVNQYGDELFSWALFKVGDKQIAEDLVQETFMSAVLSVTSFEGKSHPKTWITSILNNKIIDHYRKEKSHKAQSVSLSVDQAEGITDTMFDANDNWTNNGMESLWVQEENLLDNQDFNIVFDLCINDLPPAWQLSISAKYFSQKETKEICQELGITTTNYWQVIHRAKLLLKKCLEQKWFSRN